eukprot:6180227-Pleurochrysis_carterae.AAC.2
MHKAEAKARPPRARRHTIANVACESLARLAMGTAQGRVAPGTAAHAGEQTRCSKSRPFVQHVRELWHACVQGRAQTLHRNMCIV